MRTDSDFQSGGIRCAAWHYQAPSRSDTRPCVVMGAAFGATRDSGLEEYAEELSAAGYDALLFDFRHLGDSDGEPRQLVSPKLQLDDFRAAVAHARGLPGVDPDKIVLWGMSLSGGQVITVAVEDRRIAAVISVVGSVDMVAGTLMGLRRDGPVPSTRLTVAALRDTVSALLGRPPRYIPIFGPPGSLAFVTAPGTADAMQAAAGRTWRNEVAARAAMEMSSVRPGRIAKDLRCPTLFQIADFDQVAAAKATVKAAFAAAGQARVRHYPCDHIDPLGDSRTAMATHQVEFLDSVFGRTAAAVEPKAGKTKRTNNNAVETATS
jgi:pimeloyl-ACP methyl ester carboxylesterase